MKHKRIISILSAFMLCVMPILQPLTVCAENAGEAYPYTLFAASEEEGAITANTGNFCVNGVVGIIDEPFSIETDSEFDTATISFQFHMDSLDDKSVEDFIILWYDEENDRFVEMDTKYDVANGTISTETTHFSRYMVVDKIAWFEVWDEELNYTNTHYEKSAVYTVLAVDCSGSMSSSDPITSEPKSEESSYYYNHCKRYEAVSNYIQAMDSDDKEAIVTFNNYANTLCALTDDKIVLTNAAEQFRNSGGTNYNNALNASIQLLNNSEGSTRKKIVLLTDGQSYVSDSVLQSAIASNIKIYTIGLGDSSDSVLQHIADATGGEFFKAYTADELLGIYEEIGVTVEVDTTDNDKDELYDVYEVTGMRVQNGNIIYTDPTKDDTDGDGLKDGEEIDTEIRHREVYFPSDVPMEASCTYFIMHSNPRLKDSDGDKLEDNEDSNPLFYEYTPTEFLTYFDSGYIEASDLRRADNGFTICMKPLGEIMNVMDITADGYENIEHFSDWYLYGFLTDDGAEVYSLIKLRTCNNNLLTPPGVSVPFREFNIDLLNESANSTNLGLELEKITGMGVLVIHHESVRTFFADKENSVNYFIADIYLELIIKQDGEEGKFPVPANAVDRVLERLEESPEVYNAEENTICINDLENLTLDERQCLLATHAGTISYNAFAAEIIFHAVSTHSHIGGIAEFFIYKSAKKADLSVAEDAFLSKGESFYAMENSWYVNQQEEIFGEY